MMPLMPVRGPACPTCACPDSSIVERGTRWGRPTERRRCRFCGREWHAPVDDEQNDKHEDQNDKPESGEPTHRPVVYRMARRPKCPECGSENTKVISTRRPIRHHKCRDCGAAFKSSES